MFAIQNIDYIITLDDKRRILRNASLVIEGDRIVAVGDTIKIATQFKGRIDTSNAIDGVGTAIVPGFVNTHAHTQEHLSRGLIPETVSTLPWAMKYFFPFQASLTEEETYISAKLACYDMLCRGTTCFIDSSILISEAHVDAVVQAVEDTGIRAVLGRGFCDRKPEELSGLMDGPWKGVIFGTTERSLHEAERLAKRGPSGTGGRVRYWATVFGLFTFCSDSLFTGIKALADKHGVGTNFHMASSIEEANGLAQRVGEWPITHLHRLGVLGHNVLLTHAITVTDGEIELLADSGTKIAHCPGAACRLAKGATRYGRIPEMLASGVTVSLGADGVCSCGTFDSVRLMALAAGLFKDARMDPTLIPAETALEMATINGAKALLWDADIGSLEAGKKADFVQYDIRRPEWAPVHDIVRNLVYSADSGSVKAVYVDGKRLLSNGKLDTVEMSALLDLAQDVGQRVAARAGLDPESRWPSA